MNKNKHYEFNLNAEYDGNIADIHMKENINGRNKTYNMILDNNDLENILNIKSVNMPIHKRLENDFLNIEVIEPKIQKYTKKIKYKIGGNKKTKKSKLYKTKTKKIKK